MTHADETDDLPLAHWIKRAYLALSGFVNEQLRPHELTYSQWQVLSFVARRDGGTATQRELQSWLKVESATLTGVIDGLERRGWLTREESSDDRRVKRLVLTTAGLAVYEAVSPWLSQAVQARVLAGLSPGQVTLAREVLQRVIENLEQASTEAQLLGH
jgi:MarR family transcriptional regulator, transcriptional regulator for hemolysin